MELRLNVILTLQSSVVVPPAIANRHPFNCAAADGVSMPPVIRRIDLAGRLSHPDRESNLFTCDLWSHAREGSLQHTEAFRLGNIEPPVLRHVFEG